MDRNSGGLLLLPDSRQALSRFARPRIPSPFTLMTIEKFEELAAKAIKGLPGEFRGRLDNVVVIVKPAPDKAQERRFGRGLLGLYEGIPLTDRGQAYSGAMPDKITLFKNNIESLCRDEEEVEQRVRRTMIHEIAHHFGISDEELIKLKFPPVVQVISTEKSSIIFQIHIRRIYLNSFG